MITETSNSILFEIIGVYTNYFKAFLKRADIQNGKYGSYHVNQDPNGELLDENWLNLGNLFVTTGVCVSMSQAIVNDKIFNLLLQTRNAKAKLVSIDIKEQFYGYCKPSFSQNKWHTAILIEDNGILFILDATCAQFGNQFVGKLIWNLNTWLSTFRSPIDSHTITDFNNYEINEIETSVKTDSYESDKQLLLYNLKNIITIDDTEREIIADFFLQGIHLLNKKFSSGNVSINDFNYMSNINNILKQFTLCKFTEQYYLCVFSTKEKALEFISEFIKNNCVFQSYLPLSNSIADACALQNVNPEEINIESSSAQTFVVIKWENIIGPSIEGIVKNCSCLLPYGVNNICNIQKDIFNGGKLLSESAYGIEKKTNTIFINISGI